jgi:hypothetical protein
VLAKFVRLRELNLNHTLSLASMDSCKTLASFLSQQECCLERLELARCLLSAAGLQALATSLKRSECLRFLRLQQNAIGDVGAKTLAEIITESGSLERVPLGPLIDHPRAEGPLWQNTAITRNAKHALCEAVQPEMLEADAEYHPAKPVAVVGGWTKRNLKVKAAQMPEVDDAAFEIDFQQVVIHFGTNKGKTVGELDQDSLSWYVGMWNARKSEEDVILLAAVRKAMQSLGATSNRA